MTQEKGARERVTTQSRPENRTGTDAGTSGTATGSARTPSYLSDRESGDTRVDTGRIPEEYKARGPLWEMYFANGSGGGHGSRSERRKRRSERGTSFASVILGWLVALGAVILLAGVVGGVVAALLGLFGVPAATGGIAGAVGAAVTLLLAYLIGGYAAGRMAGRSGAKHGLFVPLFTLLLVILLGVVGAVAGAVLGANFGGQISALTAQIPPGATQAVPQNFAAIASVAGIVTFLIPFVGGLLGGIWGAKRTMRA
jgi:hypothetical protein